MGFSVVVKVLNGEICGRKLVMWDVRVCDVHELVGVLDGNDDRDISKNISHLKNIKNKKKTTQSYLMNKK